MARRRARAWAASIVAAVLCSSVSACGDGGVEAVGYVAVAFPTDDPVSVDELRGTAVLLAGWATWCVPCERELPELDEFARMYSGDDLRVIAVNLDVTGTGDEAIEAMIDRLGVTLPIWRDPEGSLLTTFSGTAMPFSVLLDRDGLVVRTWNGVIDVGTDSFASLLATALA